MPVVFALLACLLLSVVDPLARRILVFRTGAIWVFIPQGSVRCHSLAQYISLVSIDLRSPPPLRRPRPCYTGNGARMPNPVLARVRHRKHCFAKRTREVVENKRTRESMRRCVSEEPNGRTQRKNPTEEPNGRTQRKNPTEEPNGRTQRKNPTEEPNYPHLGVIVFRTGMCNSTWLVHWR
jgi:hypothetical protein